MSYTPDINLRELKKKGLLDEKKFYELLSDECNYVGPEVVKENYLALVRVLTKQLRKNGVVRLPLLGDMALVKQKPRLGLVGKIQMVVSGAYSLKFYAARPWKEYFKKIGEQSGQSGKLDPREKIGQELPEYNVME